MLVSKRSITPVLSKTVGKRTNFEIAGQGTVRIYIEIDKQKVNLILQNVLHIPELHSNLISIPRVCSQGLNIIFGLNAVTTQFSNGCVAIKGVWKNKLYIVNVLETLQVFLVNSL